jgi:hypothetical protein
MIRLSRRIFQRRGYVAGFQKRIIIQDFFPRRAGSEEIKNILHAKTEGANAGASAALVGVDGDAMKFTQN